MASYKYIANSNLQTVTLGSAYTAASGSMTLTAGHGARLPSTGDFWMAYNNGAGTIRLFKVTARATDTLTVVVDATEGNGDGDIASGETLRSVVSVAALNQLRADMCGYGTYANLPATCNVGDQYKTSDSMFEFVCTATNTWTAFRSGRKVIIPVNSTFSDLNAPSIVETSRGAVYIAVTQNGTDNIRGRVKNLPTAPWTIETAFIPEFLSGTANRLVGLALYDGTKLKFLSVGNEGSFKIRVDNWNSVTSWSSQLNYGTQAWGSPVCLRIVDDNTNWLYYVGPSFDNMALILTQARNNFLTPTKAGMVVFNQTGVPATGAHFFHWDQY